MLYAVLIVEGPGVPFILYGNKIDLREDAGVLERLAESKQKMITHEMGMRMAKEIKAACYMEGSALTQQGLKAVFDTAIRISLQPKREQYALACCMC
jgi:GTPase SAR1 family protein